MIKVTCVDLSGEIRQSVSSSSLDEAFSSVPHNLFGVGYGPEDKNSWYSFELEEWMPKGDQPTPEHVWDTQAKNWYDPRTLQDLKDAKWAQVKAAREAAIDAALPTPYGTFDSDASARTSITDAVLMLQSLAALGQPTTVDFTLADNSVVTLTTAEMVNVGLLLGQKVQAAYAAARALRAQIEASTTPAEVAAVAW